jgi:hypothetical protein
MGAIEGSVRPMSESIGPQRAAPKSLRAIEAEIQQIAQQAQECVEKGKREADATCQAIRDAVDGQLLADIFRALAESKGREQ